MMLYVCRKRKLTLQLRFNILNPLLCGDEHILCFVAMDDDDNPFSMIVFGHQHGICAELMLFQHIAF